MSIYPRPIEIKYYQVSEFIVRQFRKSLIEIEYGITAKPDTLVDTMSNAVLEQIRQVLGNLVRTFNISQSYVDENYPWMGVFAAAAFAICSTTNIQKGYRRKLIKIASLKMVIKLTTTIKSEITSCSLNTVHTNMKRHI